MTSYVKKVINNKNLFSKLFAKNKDITNSESNLEKLRSLQNNLSNVNVTSKQKFFAKCC